MDQASPEGEGVSGEAGFLWVFSLIGPQEVIQKGTEKGLKDESYYGRDGIGMSGLFILNRFLKRQMPIG